MLNVEDDDSDCSYMWQITNSDDFYNKVFEIFYPDTKIDPKDTLGFTAPVNSFKFILIRNSTNWEQVLEHEGEHAKCNLKYPTADYFNEFCNFQLDKQFMTRGSVYPDYGYVNAVPTPEISEKMAFTKLMYSNQYVTLNRLDTIEQ